MSDTDQPPTPEVTVIPELPRGRGNPAGNPGHGGHSKLMMNPEIRNKIVRLVRAGNYRETAAAAAGISGRTLNEWLRRGARWEKEARTEDAQYADFNDELELAEAESEARDIMRISRAAIDTAVGRGDWRAIAWRRERMNPKKWGYRVRLEVVEEIEAFMAKLQRNLPPEIYEQVLNASIADDSPAAARLDQGSTPGEHDADPGSAAAGGGEGTPAGEVPE